MNDTHSPTLAVLLVLHTIFLAVRSALVRLLGPTPVAQVDEALSQGHLMLARGILDAATTAPNASAPDVDMVTILVAAIDTAYVGVSVHATHKRRFYARVSLLGHRDLGVCHVRETDLAGADILMVEQLVAEGAPVHWIRAQSLYDAEEIPRAVALREVDEAEQERTKRAEASAKREQQKAEQVAQLRALRAGATVTIRVVGDEITVTTDVPGALLSQHDDVRAVANDLGAWNVYNHHGADKRCDGIAIDGGTGRAERLLLALFTLGFMCVEQSAPVERPVEPDAPIAADDFDSDELRGDLS